MGVPSSVLTAETSAASTTTTHGGQRCEGRGRRLRPFLSPRSLQPLSHPCLRPIRTLPHLLDRLVLHSHGRASRRQQRRCERSVVCRRLLPLLPLLPLRWLSPLLQLRLPPRGLAFVANERTRAMQAGEHSSAPVIAEMGRRHSTWRGGHGRSRHRTGGRCHGCERRCRAGRWKRGRRRGTRPRTDGHPRQAGWRRALLAEGTQGGGQGRWRGRRRHCPDRRCRASSAGDHGFRLPSSLTSLLSLLSLLSLPSLLSLLCPLDTSPSSLLSACSFVH